MNRNDIEAVARLVKKAFIEIRDSINANKVNDDMRTAISTLPMDNITGAAENRLKKFPNDCCMDASMVLAIIFIALAEQNGYIYNQIMHIRCLPTDKTKTLMFDFHQWLSVEGYNVDIAFEQCKTVLRGNEDKVVFDVHPLIGSDDYNYGRADAVIEEPFAEFANYIITNYFRRRDE